jgi:hypothetical protein
MDDDLRDAYIELDLQVLRAQDEGWADLTSSVREDGKLEMLFKGREYICTLTPKEQ